MLSLIKESASNWVDHKDARLGAALAYYSIFSVGPLILIAIAVAGLLFGQDAVRGEVAAQMRGMLGDTGAQAIQSMLADAGRPREGLWATIFGIATLLFAAVGVVVQLKDALNTVWEVDPKKGGVWLFIRTYMVSLAGVLSLGFLLLVSLLASTALAAGSKVFAPFLSETLLQIVSSAISLGFITILFAMMFKWLPDATIAWRDVWPGAAATAVLFEIGKFLIGLYIGKQGLESTYGAAASLVVLLIWVYYSSQILLMGAEFTRVYAKRYGSLRFASPAVPRPPEGTDHPSEQDMLRALAAKSPYALILLSAIVGWAASTTTARRMFGSNDRQRNFEEYDG